MLRNKKKAFTITELVIVIAVIAILAAVLIPTFSNVVASANKSAALQTCTNSLKEYLATVSTDSNTTNDNPVGMVFEHNGYYFVYLNGTLHNIEPTALTKDAAFPADIKGFTALGGDGEVKAYVTFKIESKSYNATVANHVFVYNVTANDKTYAGYFAYDTEAIEYEGATLAKATGIAEYTVTEGGATTTPITLTTSETDPTTEEQA